ncbi:uncharacterized protein LOC129738159, partial [Uranotaenia lowii]|uniref:uncharacterized protein LOC129738159 n=1 Tax=Uranotaenia lowii TaxID=190385 RepID=UPI00247874B8
AAAEAPCLISGVASGVTSAETKGLRSPHQWRRSPGTIAESAGHLSPIRWENPGESVRKGLRSIAALAASRGEQVRFPSPHQWRTTSGGIAAERVRFRRRTSDERIPGYRCRSEQKFFVAAGPTSAESEGAQSPHPWRNPGGATAEFVHHSSPHRWRTFEGAAANKFQSPHRWRRSSGSAANSEASEEGEACCNLVKRSVVTGMRPTTAPVVGTNCYTGYCEFVQCVRRINANSLINMCILQTLANKDLNVESQRIGFYVNATSCILARARCNPYNPITGELQAPLGPTTPLGLRSTDIMANALQVTPLGDIRILAFPVKLMASDLFCSSRAVLDQSTFGDSVC